MKSLIIKKVLLLTGFSILCVDGMSIGVNDVEVVSRHDSLKLGNLQDSAAIASSKYDKRIHRYRKNWGSLVPTQLVLQTCGNMGLFSFGVGWDYGRHRQWETELLFGFIPKYDSRSVKMTMTLKENFIPWSISLKNGWAFEPLSCSIYFNTVFGADFWTKQPTKYENGYYPFSTRIRPNICLGERIYKEVPKNKRKFVKGFYFFYELGTNDICFMRFYRNGGKSEFWDILGLSLGLKAQLF